MAPLFNALVQDSTTMIGEVQRVLDLNSLTETRPLFRADQAHSGSFLVGIRASQALDSELPRTGAVLQAPASAWYLWSCLPVSV